MNKIKGIMDWGIFKLIGGFFLIVLVMDLFGYRLLDNGDYYGG